MARAPHSQGDLFDAPSLSPDGTIAINWRCLLRTRDDHRVVVVAGIPLLHYALDDAASQAHAMVSLIAQGWATQREVAQAFGCSTRTVRRHQRRFEDGGLAALGRGAGFPTGRERSVPGRARRIHRLKSDGVSQREIAARVGISEKAVRNALRRLGWKATPLAQPKLPFAGKAADNALQDVISGSESTLLSADPNLSAFSSGASLREGESVVDPAPEGASPGADPNLSAFDAEDEPMPWTSDRDPTDRRGDRVLAYMGLLHDAAPLFRSGSRVPRAGVLLAIPAILRSGVLSCAREVYGSIGPAFYGLRTTILALVLLSLTRIKRPEALKEHSPQDLGRILGLDRAPEVKTLRRKLKRLGERATEFGRALAERRVADHADALGFLYTDGHVRVYHGARTIPKTHVARMRISLPATSDYWVHDQRGEPLFVITTEANDAMTKMLPPILEEIRSLVGEQRVTIVFDRGGWSPKLFKSIIEQDFDLLTYRKGKSRRVPRRLFSEHKATIDGRTVSYVLADRGTHLLRGRLRLRQVTRLSDNGHQTPIITSRRDLPAVEVAYRMFERWRQENFFKYMRQEYALDALVDYAVEAADPQRDVPNPAWNKLSGKIRAARAKISLLSAALGMDVIGDEGQSEQTLREFETEHAGRVTAIKQAVKRLDALLTRRKKVPRRVPVKDVVEGDVVKLSTGRKHLSNVLKMVAYQVESELVRTIAPHYRRSDDEGRTLIRSVLLGTADIDVTDEELRITLQPLSSRHRTRAVAALCDELNASPVRFPGTRLRMRFDVADA